MKELGRILAWLREENIEDGKDVRNLLRHETALKLANAIEDGEYLPEKF